MLEYDRIDLSKGIDFNRISGSRECSICHYCYFLKISFSFQAIAWDCCHNLMQKTVRFNDVTVAYIKGNDSRIYFFYMGR